MDIMIKSVEMSRTDEGYLGKVQLEVVNHQQPYEVLLQSKDGSSWGYALHFLDESGPEEEIDALDQYLEENDEAFDRILDAAEQALA